MNNKRKVIIAAFLFIFLGLTIFTFANPEENNEIGNEQQDNNQNMDIITDGDNSYENALAAVITAETRIDNLSYENAIALVELVTNNNQKEELSNRLEEVRIGIDVKSLVTTLEKMTNEATTKEDMDKARIYRMEKNVVVRVKTVTIARLRENLQTRLNTIAKLLDDEELILNIDNNALLKEKTKIEIVDQNELTIMLTDNDGTRKIQNGAELSDGMYTLNVKDKALNEITITFTIDTTAPNLTISSPESYQLEIYTEYVDKGYSAYDNLEGDITNLIKMTYEFKESGTTEYINTDKIDNSKLGTYRITYTVNDKVGNTAVGTREIEYADTLYPVINLPGTKGANNNELHVEYGSKITYEDLLATVTDATAPKTIAPYKASLLISNIENENTYNITDFTNGLDTKYLGRYNIEYKVTDKGGNETKATMFLMMLDTKKPILTSTIDSGITYVKAEDSTHIVFNIYKDGELKKSLNSKTLPTGKEFALTLENYAEGEYLIEAIDEANNKTTIKTLVTSNEILGIKYNDSVKLTKNGTLEEVIQFINGQDKVIDLNGHALTIKNIVDLKQTFQNDGKLTIKNGTIVNDSTAHGLVENLTNGELIIENVAIEDSSDNVLIKNNGGKVTITNKPTKKNITLNSAQSAIENNGGELTVKNVIIDGKYNGKKYPVKINSGNVVIEDTDISSPFGGINIWGGTVTITKVNVKINPVAGITAQHAIYIANSTDANVTINSGSFAGRNTGLTIHTGANETGKITVKINEGNFSSTKNVALKVVKDGSASVSLTIEGGTFTKTNITTYLDEKFAQDLSTWKVFATTISEIKNNDSVKLIKNETLEEIVKIAKGQDKVIDLNGYTLNVNSIDDTKKSLQNNGKLTIKNGTIVTDSSSNGLVENLDKGELILDKVTIEDNGNSTLIKNNGGKVIITNKTQIVLNSAHASIENNGGELIVKGTAEDKIKITGKFSDKAYLLKINSGTAVLENIDFSGIYGGLNIYGGTVTINNVNITIPTGGIAQHAIYIANVNDSKVTINSGTFISRSSGIHLHREIGKTGNISVEINGGTFKAKKAENALRTTLNDGLPVDLTIKGGTFKDDNVLEYLAEGYKQNPDGSVTKE